tara:strand:+ start:303 stop:848 length:546 start_codon:yes stop_codon:yes gene_type:complete
MTYKIILSPISDSKTIHCLEHNHYIPLDPANRDYQKVLDDIIEQGASCFEGDIPAELQAAADAKLFAQQVNSYITARDRVAQYQLSVGRAEVVESQATGEQVYNEETFEMDDIMVSVVVVSAIEALEATVEVTTQEMYDEDPVTETVDNPLIIKDNAERAVAQEIVDTTPTEVKQHVVENT